MLRWLKGTFRLVSRRRKNAQTSQVKRFFSMRHSKRNFLATIGGGWARGGRGEGGERGADIINEREERDVGFERGEGEGAWQGKLSLENCSHVKWQALIESISRGDKKKRLVSEKC